MDREVDLNQRGELERAIVGALRGTIDAHGPIAHATAPSAAKRVIAAVEQRNRRLRSAADARPTPQ